uniref:Uncharacterized protein n=1 Tax=Laticauda laticaudata TaxID=8630 RepID=A0A8C5SHI9_LATLA
WSCIFHAFFIQTSCFVLFLLQLLLLIGFICVRSSPWTNYSSYSYVEIVCIYDLIMIFIFYIVYIFRAYRKLTCISWPLVLLMTHRFLDLKKILAHKQEPLNVFFSL